jgi:hypothetical protein
LKKLIDIHPVRNIDEMNLSMIDIMIIILYLQNNSSKGIQFAQPQHPPPPPSLFLDPIFTPYPPAPYPGPPP